MQHLDQDVDTHIPSSYMLHHMRTSEFVVYSSLPLQLLVDCELHLELCLCRLASCFSCRPVCPYTTATTLSSSVVSPQSMPSPLCAFSFHHSLTYGNVIVPVPLFVACKEKCSHQNFWYKSTSSHVPRFEVQERQALKNYQQIQNDVPTATITR